MKDWSGLKYQVAEELGEDIDIIIFKFDLDTEKFTFYKRKHSEFDGLSAMADVLKSEGATVNKLPMQSIGKEPNFLNSFKLMRQFLSFNGNTTAVWKDKVDFELVGKSVGFTFCYFDKEQTNKILDKKRTSLSAFLIYTLDKTSLNYFIEKDGVRKWILPLNMRQRNKHEHYYGNCTASFILHTGPGVSERDIQDELLNSIKRDDHWGSWFYTNMPRYIGLFILRKVAAKLRNNGHGYLTNMGKWPSRNISFDEKNNDIWNTASIPSRVVPIAAACILWNDQLAITLRTHPSLKQDLDGIHNLMKDWIENINNEFEILESPKVFSISEDEIK